MNTKRLGVKGIDMAEMITTPDSLSPGLPSDDVSTLKKTPEVKRVCNPDQNGLLLPESACKASDFYVTVG